MALWDLKPLSGEVSKVAIKTKTKRSRPKGGYEPVLQRQETSLGQPVLRQ